MKIFNKPCVIGTEMSYIKQVIDSGRMAGSGDFTTKCQQWFIENLNCVSCLLTPSCTAALEMAAILIDIQPGDEVIMPSYTFVSTANAFVLRGAKVVFVDIEAATMNIDVSLIEAAITDKTKAIVPVHYAGVSCNMEALMAIANRHRLFVIEDAAQAIGALYKGQPVAGNTTICGHMAAFSFHESKNVTSGGEGGALVINDPEFADRAEIIREKGTNRKEFMQGLTDKYSWKDIGSSYLMSELQAAYLYPQLLAVNDVTGNRRATWKKYYDAMYVVAVEFGLELTTIPDDCQHNGHLFYVKLRDQLTRKRLLAASNELTEPFHFHYVPLHTSIAGQKFGRFVGSDIVTNQDSARLVRFPLWYNMADSESDKAIECFLAALLRYC